MITFQQIECYVIASLFIQKRKNNGKYKGKTKEENRKKKRKKEESLIKWHKLILKHIYICVYL